MFEKLKVCIIHKCKHMAKVSFSKLFQNLNIDFSLFSVHGFGARSSGLHHDQSATDTEILTRFKNLLPVIVFC